ncbi:MAG: hypothetical protein P1U58_01015 [Verrucomicrobiales bacterium]|nr:hypothetical protein [Verrucomicrobiales bacterium]
MNFSSSRLEALKQGLSVLPILWIFVSADPLAGQDIVSQTAKTFELALGQQLIEFTTESSSLPGDSIQVISLHRNEDTSFPIVRTLLKTHPGQFIRISTSGGRRLSLKSGGSKSFTMDPNRMFSPAGIERDLRNFSFFSPEIAAEVQAFSKAYLNQVELRAGKTVIAVHNNTNGGYSIESYLEGGSEELAGRLVHIEEGEDLDNFVLVTDLDHFEALKAAGFNTVLQDNENAPDDGSLSVYCGRNGIKYLNVEAEFGDAAEQEQMLRAAFELATAKQAYRLPEMDGRSHSVTAPRIKVAPEGRQITSGAISLDDSPGNRSEMQSEIRNKRETTPIPVTERR